MPKDIQSMSHRELVEEASKMGVTGRPGFQEKNKAVLDRWDDEDLRETIRKYRLLHG
jgi:hypothetical protein